MSSRRPLQRGVSISEMKNTLEDVRSNYFIHIASLQKESGYGRQKGRWVADGEASWHNFPCLPHLIYCFIAIPLCHGKSRQFPGRQIWMAQDSQGLKEDLAYDPPCHPRAVSCFHSIPNDHGAADHLPVCDSRYIHTHSDLLDKVNTVAYPRQPAWTETRIKKINVNHKSTPSTNAVTPSTNSAATMAKPRVVLKPTCCDWRWSNGQRLEIADLFSSFPRWRGCHHL